MLESDGKRGYRASMEGNAFSKRGFLEEKGIGHYQRCEKRSI